MSRASHHFCHIPRQFAYSVSVSHGNPNLRLIETRKKLCVLTAYYIKRPFTNLSVKKQLPKQLTTGNATTKVFLAGEITTATYV